MSRPRIGVAAGVELARTGPWEEESLVLPRNYLHALHRAGAQVLVLPPEASDSAEEALEVVDALLLSGGMDVDPATYGAKPHPQTDARSPDRDRFEIVLTRGALERDLPVLGVCRGLEVLNVALGGTLVQHLPDVLGHNEHCHTPGAFADHEVRVEPGSLAAMVVGAERTWVKSHHHQGIAALGEGAIATGWSIPDDIVEAIELPDRSFALGVLWHPEEDERDRVLSSFVEHARSAVRAG